MNTWNVVRTTNGGTLVQLQQVFSSGESSGGSDRTYIIYGDTIEDGAIATTMFDDTCSSFLDTDVELVLNSSTEWSIGAVSGSYDIETVLLHELGHADAIREDYDSYIDRVKEEKFEGYSNKEEKRNIVGVEKPAAEMLGEPVRETDTLGTYIYKSNIDYDKLKKKTGK